MAKTCKKATSIDDSNSGKITPASTPIFQTSVYNYPSLSALDDYYNGLIPGAYIYSRNGLPNAEELGNRVAKLEHAEKGVVCSSGMAALFVALCSNLRTGNLVLASVELYGGTSVLLCKELARFGIRTSFVDTTNLDSFRKATEASHASVILVETISNPTMKVCDIREIAKTAKETEAIVIVDNTFATPFLVRPIEKGADVVMHSGTKSLGGHSDLTIGVLCGNAKLMGHAVQFNTRIGTIAGPFDCWLACRSLSTWQLRFSRSCENALRMARFLEKKQDVVARVFYPGLESHPQHELANELFEKGMYGSMLSFDIRGGIIEAEKFIKALRKATLTPSLGSLKTTVSHPGKTSHRHLTPEQKALVGITDSMIRVSVGIEAFDEIRDDFNNAFKAF